MAEAPSWADQWGAGGIGAMPQQEDSQDTKDGTGNKKKDAKAASGFFKVKTAAITGAQKIKMGAVTGVKWVKKQYQKKGSSK